MTGPGLAPELQKATERWFLRRGIPHFIDQYNAREDVFTRALPILSLVFVVEIFVATDANWLWWQNTLAVGAGAALLAGSYAGVNHLRGRPLFQRPNAVNAIELAIFVVLPALLPLVIGGRWRAALMTMLVNVVILALVYLWLLYGVIPMLRWAMSHMWTEIGGIFRLMGRSLPLVLVFSMFIFLNAEMWQVAADFTPAYFAAAISVLLGLASLFVVLRLPREVDALRRFDSWDQVADLLADAPLGPIDCDGLDGKPNPPRLRRADWINVGMIWWFSQLVQIVLVAVLIGSFYVVFGAFTVRETTILQWTTDTAVSGVNLPGTGLVVTWELVTVAGFIGAFSALQFAISAVTDETYRQEFLADLVNELREAFAVRALYLAKLGVTASGRSGLDES